MEWNGGMEWWNGIVEWTTGMVRIDHGMLHRTYLIIQHVLYSEQYPITGNIRVCRLSGNE